MSTNILHLTRVRQVNILSEYPAGPGRARGMKERVVSSIFINYRRDDTSGHAGRLYDELSRRFGSQLVFMDLDQIAPGQDFLQVIQGALATTRVVLVLIGRQWLTVSDSAGRRRLDNASDYVRIEVASALRRSDVTVIPVLIQGATVPDARDVPSDPVPLTRRNGIELRDSRWRDDVASLIRTLDLELKKPRPKPQPRQEPPRQQPLRQQPGVVRPSKAGGTRITSRAIVIAIVVVAAVLLVVMSTSNPRVFTGSVAPAATAAPASKPAQSGR